MVNRIQQNDILYGIEGDTLIKHIKMYPNNFKPSVKVPNQQYQVQPNIMMQQQIPINTNAYSQIPSYSPLNQSPQIAGGYSQASTVNSLGGYAQS